AFVEQRGQAADFRPSGCCAEDQRALVDRLLEELADRLAVDQRQVLLFEPQHRSAPRRIERIERVAAIPRMLAHQLIADALLAQREPDFAAEWTKGEVIELPHGPAWSCRNRRAASTGCCAHFIR